MLPDAPARLSTMTCCPHALPRSALSSRATRSTLPPGGNGVMMRTSLAGNSAAKAVAAANTAANAATPLIIAMGRVATAASNPEGEFLKRVAVLGRAAAAYCERPRDFAHVKIVLRIEREAVGCGETARLGHLRRAPAREHLAVLVVYAHARAAHLGLGNRPVGLRDVAF